MNRTISNIERAAAARERMNHQCRTTEFRKFGAQMRYETGAFEANMHKKHHSGKSLCCT